jgi:hypothetical protein
VDTNCDLLTIGQLAEKLGVPVKRASRWPSAYPDFPAYRMPGCRMFKLDEVLGWMKERNHRKSRKAVK